MKCYNTFEDYLAVCPESIKVRALLAPAETYTWNITDKFGRVYEGEVLTDGNGFFEIPIADLPLGLLTQYSGDFKLTILDGGCRAIKFKMADEYEALFFHIVGGSAVKDTLGCEFSCTPAPGSTAMIPFTAASTVNIDWDDYDEDLGNNPTFQIYHELSPGIFTLVSVEVIQTRASGVLTDVVINNGGPATGYIIISS